MFTLRNFVLGIVLCVLANTVFAKDTITGETSSYVSLRDAQRVLVFSGSRNAISAEGIILVCKQPNRDGESDTCHDQQGKNAWMDINNLKIPGYELVGFSHHLVYGWTTSSVLRLYFRKK